MSSAVKENGSQAWYRMRAEFQDGGGAAAVLAGRTGMVEAAILDAWQTYLAPAYPTGMALLAVGGFGRRELFPYSDVDLLILVEEEPHSGAKRDALSAFLRALWDRGLRLSHSVRTPQECCEVHAQNVELNVSLLDQRFLAGDEAVYDRMVMTLPRFLNAERANLIRHLCRLTRVRHVKYYDTIYHLEPNIKETPGGLRDLHLVWWLGKLRNAQAAGSTIPPPESFKELEPARDFLCDLRCYLHYTSGRDNNLLTFDAQEGVVEQPFTHEKNPAVWMREYYRHAREIHRAALRAMEASEAAGNTLLSQFREWRSRLSNAEFTVSRERVYLRMPQMLEKDPEIAIRLFQFVARHGMRPALETERRLAEWLEHLRSYFSAPRDLWPALAELLALPHAALALRAMSDTGVLQALFPEWERIDCLVVRDFYHRYTVDEHTLVAIDSLSQLPSSRNSHLRRFADLQAEVEDRALLIFALVFHDIGKGGGEGRHVEESLAVLEGVMDRIRFPEAKRGDVRFLIGRHLELSAAIGSRDLEDPATARYVADRVGTVERLKMLTLLTYADVDAVTPGAMTPWRLEQLWRLYVVAYNELTRELETERIDALPVVSPEKSEFLCGFPTRYLRTHSDAEIDAHVELGKRAAESGVAIDLTDQNGVHKLVVITRDRPFLLTTLAGVLAGFGFNILKAEAFSNRRGRILDTFVFTDPSRTLELNPSEIDRLRVTIERAALGKADVKRMLQNRPKPRPPSRNSRVEPRVAFDSQASDAATLLEIVAEDRPGLLHDLTAALSANGCNIEVVLIDTEAHKALDVFYITREGRKLEASEQEDLQQSLLKICRDVEGR